MVWSVRSAAARPIGDGKRIASADGWVSYMGSLRRSKAISAPISIFTCCATFAFVARRS